MESEKNKEQHSEDDEFMSDEDKEQLEKMLKEQGYLR